MNFASKVIAFNTNLVFKGKLPPSISIMNPFKENPYALNISSDFYTKYFSDDNKRHLILGINPGRLGGGITGIPFTDTKRLSEFCDMEYEELNSHEPSSVYIYDLIMAYGGVKEFYQKFYINSVCPLGFLIKKENGNLVNYNYYDDRQLETLMSDFILKSLKAQINFGIHTDKCFVLGNNKNFKYLSQINETHKLFKTIVPIEHPRYIMQYKQKEKSTYLNKHINLLSSIHPKFN